MFEAGFTCILSKSLMNTRTSREPRRAIRALGFSFLHNTHAIIVSIKILQFE